MFKYDLRAARKACNYGEAARWTDTEPKTSSDGTRGGSRPNGSSDSVGSRETGNPIGLKWWAWSRALAWAGSGFKPEQRPKSTV